jgi:hypothetical protein
MSTNNKDIERDAGMEKVAPTASAESASSAAATVRSPPRISDCKFGWRDISYSVDTKNGKKQILQNVTGCVEKGTLALSFPLVLVEPVLTYI